MVQVFSISEPEVISQLNFGRFAGHVDGCVVMEGENYRGHLLFCQKDTQAEMLDCSFEEEQLVDFAVRACLAKCLRKGAKQFVVRKESPPLQLFWENVVGANKSSCNIDWFLNHCANCKKCTRCDG